MVAHTRIDRYEIKDVLGEGGMGVVYRAFDPNRKGFVALKTMKDAADPAALELFNQEWRTLANLSHPNIVDVLNSGAFEDDDQRRPFFVMPLLPGKTLDKLIKESGHLPIERVVEILLQTCRGLQAAHSTGLVHRDLKPSNLFVLRDDSVKIIDFGMVHLADAAKSFTGIKGTLHYMAPEQIEMKEVTPATDIFALGVVAYEALTGRKPFDRPTDRAIVDAIRREFPPPPSEFNPGVDKTMSQVIAKAMAKNPWNRFASAREFSDYLQRALKGDTIESFDSARLQPRLERARKAVGEGEFDYAHEILDELQLEGNLDSEINRLLDQVREGSRAKAIRQLLDSARTRLQEEEFPLAWQKIQEALQRDPGNAEALGLQAEIDTRRNDQQVEKWRRLVHQHLHNNAFTQARHAVEEIRKIRADDPSIRELLQAADRRQQEFQKACEEKEQHFQSAMRAYGSGEISAALSKFEKLFVLDSRAPGLSLPGRDVVYRETYEKVRSEWESVQSALAEVERVIASGDLVRATEIANEQGAKYPNDLGLRALKLKVEDLRRQQKSSFIAETGRRVESEPDLNRSVQYLEEALARYPNEPHFEELAASLRKKRDLVDSIVAKARQSEEQGMPNEALGHWTTLRNIYPQYPGLDFEYQRVLGACDLQRRQEAKTELVSKIDDCLQSGDYERAYELAVEALEAFAADQELQTLKRLAQEARDRGCEAGALTDRAQTLVAERKYPEAIDSLRRARSMDPPNAAICGRLADALAAQAQIVLANDWRASELLVQEALQVKPDHILAKSLRPAILLSKRAELIDRCASEARELQASGDLTAALDKIQQGLVAYPNDGRLTQLQKTLRDQVRVQRDRDFLELKQSAKRVQETRDETSLTQLFERSILISKRYPGDHEISAVASEIEEEARTVALDATKLFPTSGGAQPALAKDTGPIARTAEPDARPVAEQRSSSRATVLAVGSAWEFVRQAEVRARVWSTSFFRHLSLGQRSALVAVPLVALTLAFIAFHQPAKHAPTGTRTTAGRIIASVEGTTVTVDGTPVRGQTLSLAPGTHQVSASKLGYKSVTKPWTVDAHPFTLNLALEPEPQAIRISADVPTARVVLDDNDIGALQGGNFSHDLLGDGTHTLKLADGKKEIFAIQFEAKHGEAARLIGAPVSREVPVAVVSRLGSRAVMQSISPGTKIPAEGRELTLSPSDTEVTVDIGSQPVTVSVEAGNAPLLAVRSGVAAKGTLAVEANVPEGYVYVDGHKSPRRLQNGKWSGQYEPGEHHVSLVQDGYERTPDRNVMMTAGKRISTRFELARVVTTAFLRIEGGTPDANVVVDDQTVGRTGPDGAFALELKPDVAHSIHLEKEHFETSVPFQRKAAVKETVLLSGTEVRLVPFGLLEISALSPSGATVAIHRAGEAERTMSGRMLHLKQGVYIVTASTTDSTYERLTRQVQIVPGQTNSLAFALPRKALPTPAVTPRLDIPDYFTAKDWKNANGFWLHEGPARIAQIHFQHVFEFQRIKRSLGRQEKIVWRTNIRGQDYVEFEVDGTNYSRRQVIGGKAANAVVEPHGAGKPDSYRITIAVDPKRISVMIGNKMVDTIDVAVEGPTSFDGKFAVRLVR